MAHVWSAYNALVIQGIVGLLRKLTFLGQSTTIVVSWELSLATVLWAALS